MTPPPAKHDDARQEEKQKEQLAQALARLILGAWRAATAEPLKTFQALGLAALVLMVGWEKAAKQLGLEVGTPPPSASATVSRDEVRAIANEAATAAADKAVASLSRRIDEILLLHAEKERGGSLASIPPLPRAYYQSETTAAAQ